MLKLFPDQTELTDKLYAEMAGCKSILIQSPTGSGKTAMATWTIMRAVRKKRRVIFDVPRRELMKQTSETLSEYGIRHSFIAAGKDFNPFAQVYIGMSDTMARRIDKLPKVDLLLPDETHFGAEARERVIKHYEKSGAWVVGWSATPWRLDGKGLGTLYKKMICGNSVRWYIENKRLSDYRYFYGRTREDFASLNKKSEKDIASFMEEKRVIIGDCVNDYMERCQGRLHIVRCTSIRHSQLTAEAFRNAGVPAMHVDGETPDDEKLRIFKAFARREIRVLTFCELLNFGFDLSQATGMNVCIESGSDMKPSRSLAGQMQFWGRMLRYKTYPAIINDHVNNYIEHGLPCSERSWTLASRQSKARGGEGTPPTKQCNKCYFVHSPAPRCPNCGHEYEIIGREIEEVDGTLHEIDINKMRNENFDDVPPLNDEETLEFLIRKAHRDGRKNPAAWAAKELAKRINRA